MINFDKKTSELNSMSLNEAKDIHALIPLAVPNIENDSIEVEMHSQTAPMVEEFKKMQNRENS